MEVQGRKKHRRNACRYRYYSGRTVAVLWQLRKVLAVVVCMALILGLVLLCFRCTDSQTQRISQPSDGKDQAIVTEIQTQLPTEPEPFDYTLCFAGDISVSDEARTTAYWIEQGRDIKKCIAPEMVEYMQKADICFVNNEFQYTTRGTALPGKPYTFRANPENVQVMQDLGVDIVSLANNHVYDFGEDALLDTLDTLHEADIPYVGAGRDLKEASSIYYYELDGLTVAFLSGTRVEWTEETKGATEITPGVFRTVDPTLLYEKTKEAAANADYVIVYMHWGIEAVTWLEEYQTETGHKLIECGADAVIGDHPHRLQGIEYYQSKPILYSLGNYWFNGMTMDTMLAQLHLSGTADDITMELQLIPAQQTMCQVLYYGTPEEQDAFYRRMESLSTGFGISIDVDGYVTAPGV